jgi:hypothetical protein
MYCQLMVLNYIKFDSHTDGPHYVYGFKYSILPHNRRSQPCQVEVIGFPSIANICLNILYFIYFIKLNRIIVINVSKMKRLMAILLEMIITAVISLDNFDISQAQNLSRTKG